MESRPVHSYMTLVQCPACRFRYMEEGEECCAECWDQMTQLSPGVTPEELSANRERFHEAIQRLHEKRLEAERETGALGSMVGMGFAPSWLETPDTPAASHHERPLPAVASTHTPTYASDNGWAGAPREAEPDSERASRAIHTGHMLLGMASGLAILTLLAFAVLALAAGLAIGATLYLVWRILRIQSRR